MDRGLTGKQKKQQEKKEAARSSVASLSTECEEAVKR